MLPEKQTETGQMDFEFDLATMAIKGKRFDEAQRRFTELIAKTHKYEAWCGLGFAKLGLILENVTVEEVMYCFEKAKGMAPESVSEIENVVFQASGEVIKSLYDVYVSARLLGHKAEKDKNRAAVATIIGAVFTMGTAIENRPLTALVGAGTTAYNYDNYLKSASNANDLAAASKTILSKIEGLTASVQKFIIIEKDKLASFSEAINSLHLDSIEQSLSPQERQKRDAEMNRIKQLEYVEQVKAEIHDPNHKFHQEKADALMLFNDRKYKDALKAINEALISVPDDVELTTAKKTCMEKLLRSDLLKFGIPCVLFGIFMAQMEPEKGGSDGVVGSMVILGIIVGIRHWMRGGNLSNLKA